MKQTKNLKYSALLILFTTALVLFAAPSMSYAADAAENAEVIYSTAESPDALPELDTGNTWPVTIDPATGDTNCESGENITLAQALGISEEKADELTSGSENENREELNDYLDEQGIYDTAETEDGQIQVAFPYACQELLVYLDQGELKNSYGASHAIYCELTKCYVLQYDSPQAAREAEELLREELGEDKVLVNLPMHAAVRWQYSTNFTPEMSTSWGVDRMALDTLRDKANNSSISRKVLVAVLDSGINRSHEMFANRTISPYSKSFIGQVADMGYDYYDDSGNGKGGGHGTHVAGTVADGTSGQISLLILKVFNYDGEGSLFIFDEGLQEAYNCGAKVANFSGAIPAESPVSASDKKTLNKYLKRFWDKGLLLVCAAGNEGVNTGYSYSFPASAAYNASVSAYESDDSDGSLNMAEWSNFGDPVDFTAPGVDIMSAGLSDAELYPKMSGTSMACPHITAAAAMIKLYNPKATPAEVFAMLKRICYKSPGMGTKDYYRGYGLPVFKNGAYPKLMRAQKITLSKTKYVYNGKVRKPSVTVKYGSTVLTAGKNYSISYKKNKKAGIATVYITGKGLFVGTVKKTFQICPKGTSLKKLKKGKKKLTITWKKQKKQTSGYQILLATNSKFTKGKKKVTVSGASKTKKEVKGLKSGKTYFVKIRTYKKVGKKKVWSAWSKVKKQKVR